MPTSRTEASARLVQAGMSASQAKIIEEEISEGGGAASTTLVDDLTTGGTNAALTAEQGVVLKTLFDTLDAYIVNNAAVRNSINTFTKISQTDVATLTTGATLTPDASEAFQTFTTSANFTIAAPVNRPSAGNLRVYVVRIIFSGAHSVTSMNAAYKYNGTAPVFSNATGKFDDLIITDDGTNITYELKAGYTS